MGQASRWSVSEQNKRKAEEGLTPKPLSRREGKTAHEIKRFLILDWQPQVAANVSNPLVSVEQSAEELIE
jgi:hypothetical protein